MVSAVLRGLRGTSGAAPRLWRRLGRSARWRVKKGIPPSRSYMVVAGTVQLMLALPSKGPLLGVALGVDG